MHWEHHAMVVGFLFVTGACFGSFLNVCLHRIPLGLSVFRPASRCPRCREPIRTGDNVPVLGWLRLKGRCRACREPIAIRYPLVELACGALVALVYGIDAFAAGGDPIDMGFGYWLLRMFVGSAAAIGATAAALALRDASDRRVTSPS